MRIDGIKIPVFDFEMSTNKKQEHQLLHRLQSHHFLAENPDNSASCQADALRNMACSLQYAAASDIISKECSFSWIQGVLERYSSIVDSPEEQNGLNNFAEGALSICQEHKNDSKEWKSSLSYDAVAKLDCVQKYFKAAKESAETILPASHVAQQIAMCDTSSVAGSTAYNRGNTAGQRPNPTVPSPAYNPKTETACSSEGVIQQQAQIGSRNHSLMLKKPDGNHELSRLPFTCNSTSSGSSEYGYGKRKFGTQGGPFSGFGKSAAAVSNSYSRVENIQNGRGTVKRDNICAEDDGDSKAGKFDAFRTANEQLKLNQMKKNSRQGPVNASNYGMNKKSLGTRRGLTSKFVPPVMNRDGSDSDESSTLLKRSGLNKAQTTDEPVDERLKNIDPKMIELIANEIMDHGPPVSWDDIAGLEFAKNTIKEIVVWPMLRPDIFTGLRGPPKGLLLFGPPGTGKTLIGKCIASQSKSTFFSISASSLTSKWVGEGEKMVRALFAVARCHQPAVIFIDEIDSLLTQRTDGEHEASRRIKTEFLVQLDGATTGEEDRILVVGATNRPQELDEAARRRFVKRLYIPLPETAARRHIVVHLLSQQTYQLTEEDLDSICDKSEGYSGADMANLCKEAALGPIRSIAFSDIENITADEVRPITHQDFMAGFRQVRASVSEADLDLYIDWNKKYGSFGIQGM
ncbi:fidgetin-like protein 1 [Lingula anatina]|uniref:Fidgetin-like protein 1 n=1 Tax=Lingula anatina TaxID=7574 RepID=A0A1S3IGH9_LINAN|nr:fidgetin-like protein 1 [Lingula anatina]XP_013397327.1 fidgetin-like protein 1 [Lingula anatina]|eukprot:XP_013397326.1 fidgetin-like protein 1 [Lingula anatina]